MTLIPLPIPVRTSPERDRMPGRFEFPPPDPGRNGSGMGEGLPCGRSSTFGNFHASTPAVRDRETLYVTLALLLISALALLLAPP